jgi:hypothetical protein
MTAATAVAIDSDQDDRPIPAAIDLEKFRYYDFRRHWTKRVIPHLGDKKLNAILVRDFNKYTSGTLSQKPFRHGDLPYQFEDCEWDWDHRGLRPRYWAYVKHAACHFLVNFNLRLATLAEPKRPWRIITSNKHSSVWDGCTILFDMNFSALGIPPAKGFLLAYDRELRPGKYRRTGWARPWQEEWDAEQARTQAQLLADHGLAQQSTEIAAA